MNNKVVNRNAIIKVAKSLGELNKNVVYVGGTVVGLYANDPAADDVRPTKDVDIIVEISTALELENLREQLKKIGFVQTLEDDIICRFRLDELKVDVMATNEISWAPSNRWFKAGFENAQTIQIENTQVKILSLPYFLASKFDAFHSRGSSDPFGNSDFEDIIYILDNNVELVSEIKKAPSDLKKYLKQEFNNILNNSTLQEAILGNLDHVTQTKRFELILNRIKSTISN